MAERKVTFLINANIKNFTKGIDTATKKFKRFGNNLQSMGRTLTSRLTLPLVGLGGAAIKTAADFETLRTSMNVLNGSVEEGARNFERLKRFSARTPFQLQDLASAQNMLQGFGMAADDAFESLSMIGDIAAVSGGSIKGIGIAFGQAAAEGRLMTRDIRQLINQGVPAIKLLADTMGVAQSEIFDLASQGKISFEILQQAFREATEEGGMFADGMEKQSNTLAGVFSTLKDNASIALGELGTSISETFDLKQVVRDVTTSIQVVVDSFTAMSRESRAKMLKIAGLFAASGPVLFAMGGFVKAMAALVVFSRKIMLILLGIFKSTFARIGAAFLFGITLGQGFTDALKGIKREGSSFGEVMMNTMKAAVDNVFGPVVDFAEKGLGAITTGIGDMIGLNDALDEFFTNFEQKARQTQGAVESVTKSLKELSGMNIDSASLPGVSVPAIDISRVSATIKKQGKELSDATKIALSGSVEAFDQARQQIQANAESFSRIIDDVIGNAIVSFAEGIGELASGTSSLADVGKGILRILGDLAIKIGSLFVSLGTAVAASLNPSALFGSLGTSAIIAGGALIAAGATLKALLAEPQGMAQGGIVPRGFPNDTYPAMLSSGETVIPAPKPLPAMGNQVIENHLYLDGHQLEIALEDRKYGRNR